MSLSHCPVDHSARRRMPWASICAAVVLAAAASAVGAAPAAPLPSSPPLAARPASFTDVSQVVAVEVPVNVIGKDGQSLRGLAAADFEILDEGQPQQVSGFEVVDLDVLFPVAPAGEPAPARARENRVEQLDSALRRHFLLLFDLSYSNPTALLRARLAARDFVLHSLRPADLAAVATVSIEQGPRLIVTFTPDRAQLARGIDTLGLRQSPLERYDPLRFVIAPPTSDSLSSTSSIDQLSDTARGVKESMLDALAALSIFEQKEQKIYDNTRVQAMARQLALVARSLNSVRGRKQVVLFSEGFDSRLLLGREVIAQNDKEAEDDFLNIAFGESYLVDTDKRYGNTVLQNTIAKMLAEFRRADCVIQAVDIGGLRAGGDATETSASSRRGSGQDALFVMADGTGGELFKNANDLRGQLEHVLQRTSVTYVLTFQRSDMKHDGAYHRLKVKAKLPAGARIAYRDGYYAPRPFHDLDPLEKNLLASEGIASAVTRRDVNLNLLVAAFRSGEAQAYVPVIIEAPGRELLDGQTDEHLAVEIYGYVSDDKGEMRDFFTQAVGLDLQKGRETLDRSGLKYYGHFDLGPGRYLVRVLVRNAQTGRTGVATRPLVVPAFAGDSPALLPPFFLESPGRWFLVRESSGPVQQRSIVYPFTINGEPYIPAARPGFAAGEEARLCLVAYNLSAGSPRLDAQVVSAEGRPVEGGKLAIVSRTATGIAGLDKFLAAFSPQGLEIGSYTLQVALTDPLTGIREANSIPFSVHQ